MLIALLWIYPCKGQLSINEFQVSNITTGYDSKRNYSEWIEIRNAGSSSVNLAGYYLTNDLNDPFMCQINYGTASANYYYKLC